jgi:hypothetical protein
MMVAPQVLHQPGEFFLPLAKLSLEGFDVLKEPR